MGSLCQKQPQSEEPYNQLKLKEIPLQGISQPKAASSRFQGLIKRKKLKILGAMPQPEFQEAQKAVVSGQKKSEQDRLLILGCFSKHFILNSLLSEDKQLVINSMIRYTVQEGDIIFEQGQPAKNFFVLSSGSLEVRINGKRANQIRQGEGFGELALLHDTKRSATIIALTQSELWGVDRETFRKVVSESKKAYYSENRQFIETVPLLQALTSQQKDSVASSLVMQFYQKNTSIITEGDEGDRLFIIKEGQVSVIKNQEERVQMGKGQFFGELSLLYNTPRTASVVAVGNDVKVLIMHRDTLNQILGKQLQQVIHTNNIQMAFSKSEVLQALNNEQQETIIKSALKVQRYSAGDTIIQKGEKIGQNLYILLTGEIRQLPSGTLLKENPLCIADNYLVSESKRIYEEEYIARTEFVEVAICSKQELEKCLGGQLSKILMKNELHEVLKKVNVFRSLSNQKISQLMSSLQTWTYKAGQTIFEQNDMGECFYIVQEGQVEAIMNGKVIRTIQKFDYFGERSLLNQEPRTATVIAKVDTSV